MCVCGGEGTYNVVVNITLLVQSVSVPVKD